ncbi:hypothetical protein CH251_05325 [Rhodococcus sp. 06-462-5]|uniref:NAD(P)/FAD-dependent oxidoreductase n=1 Tax=unclassified Rhodococcus (in: high G+C Gram-positive bacteria) TaxID=192944 RepID=UPI000B9A3C09|nr:MULTISPECIES: FAD-dependent oxidoreductase [unclassified Rhodococcus (in: high G+C Gram-positive bacteria)]OZC77214.1 hypothetical protein CH251_05325 [Rhodococcus sp. 06-462-5]OZE63371.1 hypothetical protein CH270_17905 [Rhodococcus sp. 02-925g]
MSGGGKHLVVVGTGVAGFRTAQVARQSGWVGDITIVGDQHHLPYDLPPLSKQVLQGIWDSSRSALVTADELAALCIEYIAADPAERLGIAAGTVVLRSGLRLTYDALVIATGASATSWPGAEGVHTLRTLDDAERLRDHLAGARDVVVIGSGFVAAEVAATVSSAWSATVHLVCRGDGPCHRSIGAPAARWLRTVHEANGVVVHAGCSAQSVEKLDGLRHEVTLDDGTRIEADVVVAGLGAAPNIGWLRGSGVPIDGGILTDDVGTVLGAATDRPIYAVGDCAQWQWQGRREPRGQHWTRATEQARAVGGLLGSGEAGDEKKPLPYVWSDQFGAKLQIIGDIDQRDDVARVTSTATTFLSVHAKDGVVMGVVVAGQPRLAIQLRRMVREAADLKTVLDAVPPVPTA